MATNTFFFFILNYEALCLVGTILETQNNTINNTNKNNNTDANKPKLDIKGPKINSTPLNIKGPKGPINIEPSQKPKTSSE